MTAGKSGWRKVLSRVAFWLVPALLPLSRLSAAPPALPPTSSVRAHATATRPVEPALPPDPRQEKRLLSLVGGEFTLKRTPHFLLVYNTNPVMVDELAIRLEDTYRAVYRFTSAAGIETVRPAQRLEVVFFNKPEEYRQYASNLNFPSRGTFGVYYEPTNRSAFFNVYNDPQLIELHAQIMDARRNLDDLTEVLKRVRGNNPVILSYGDGRQERLSKTQAKRRLNESETRLRALDGRRANYSERINQTVVQHEAAHQVLFNAGVHPRRGANPKWIVEGLACLFETPPSDWGAGFTAINQLRLRDFRNAMAPPAQNRALVADDFVDAIRADRLVSPRLLVSDPAVFNEREERGATVYALAWSLTHFLHRQRPKQLSAYLKEIAGRKIGREVSAAEDLALFERYFGKLDDAFLRQWGRYILQLGYRPPVGL